MTSKQKPKTPVKKDELTTDSNSDKAGKPPVVDAGELVASLSTHDVNQAAIDAHAAKEAQNAGQSAAEPPAAPVKGKGGRPKGAKTGTGPRSKYKGAEAPKKPASFIGGIKQPTPEIPQGIDSRPAAAALVGLEEMICAGLISDEWAMQNEEREANIAAIAKYFDSKGGVEMSPLAEVALMQAGYIAQRLVKPKTQNKLTLAKAWLVSKWHKFKDRNKPKPWEDKGEPKTDGARADSGSNNVGQNHASDPFKPSIPGESN